MKFSNQLKNGVVEVVCYAYILLFTYAAISKLLDFENFQVQLGQSPLLSAFAAWISWLVPISELIIAAALVSRYRLVALFLGFNLMFMFTAYISIILNYSSFIPCSCGGILDKLGWKDHLIFNTVFTLIAVVAILMFPGNVPHNTTAQLIISVPQTKILQQ